MSILNSITEPVGRRILHVIASVPFYSIVHLCLCGIESHDVPITDSLREKAFITAYYRVTHYYTHNFFSMLRTLDKQL